MYADANSKTWLLRIVLTFSFSCFFSLFSLFPEHQATLFKQWNQPIPPSLQILLQEARKQNTKRNAKRLANRKSASTSRARKKAFVQTMTEMNTQLKRQAQILSLIPDVVVCVNVSTGRITFCSSTVQIQRVLRYTEDLVGRAFEGLVVPSSRAVLEAFLQKTLERDGNTTRQEKILQGGAEVTVVSTSTRDELKPAVDGNADKDKTSSHDKKNKTIASDDPFPLSVVVQKGNTSDNDNPYQPYQKQPSSSLTNGSSSRDSLAEDNKKVSSEASESSSSEKALSTHQQQANANVPTNSKLTQEANTNLARNVQLHNEQQQQDAAAKAKFKDDVVGEPVTAHNAGARLSSLRHAESSGTDRSEDSGYRESNSSQQEETSSDTSLTTEGQMRRLQQQQQDREGMYGTKLCSICFSGVALTQILFGSQSVHN